MAYQRAVTNLRAPACLLAVGGVQEQGVVITDTLGPITDSVGRGHTIKLLLAQRRIHSKQLSSPGDVFVRELVLQCVRKALFQTIIYL